MYMTNLITKLEEKGDITVEKGVITSMSKKAESALLQAREEVKVSKSARIEYKRPSERENERVAEEEESP